MLPAEQYIKKHFPGIESETWYPVIVAIAESYASYASIEKDKEDLAKLKEQSFKLFYY